MRRLPWLVGAVCVGVWLASPTSAPAGETIGAHCVRGHVVYSGVRPYVLYESWPAWTDGSARWEAIGYGIGPDVSVFTPLRFSTWTPVPVTYTADWRGATVAWTSERDVQIQPEWQETCRVRTLIPLVVR